MYALIARTYDRYLKASARSPGLVLAIILLSSGLLLWAGTNIKIKGDLEDLFPDGTPAVARAREAQKVLGATQELRVLVGSADREQNRRVATELGAYLSELRVVGLKDASGAPKNDMARVEVRRDISFFEKNGLLFMPLKDLQEMQDKVSEAIQKAVKKNLDLDDGFELDDDDDKPKPAAEAKKDELELPSIDEIKRDYKVEGFNEYFESPDGQVVAVKAYPDFKAADSTKTSAMNDALDAWIAKAKERYPDVSFTTDGDFSQVTRAAKQITSDAAESGIVALVIIAILMFAFFRRLRVVLVAVVVLFVTFAYTMGFAYVGIGYLNLITSISFTILFGMSVDYIVHGVARVDEEYQGGRSLEEAVRIGLFGLARPVFNAMLTTAVTFWALIFFDFRGFSQLGVIAGFGVVFALIAFYAVYPPFVFLAHRVWKQKPRTLKQAPPADEHGPALGLRAAPPVKLWQRKAAWGILGGTALLTIGSLVILMLPRAPSGVDVAVEATPDGPVYVIDRHNSQPPERTHSYQTAWDALDKATPKFFDPSTGRFRPQAAAGEDQLKTKYKQAESRGVSPALVITKDLAETERLQRYLQAHHGDFPTLTEVRSIYSFVPPDQDEKLAIIKETKRKIDNKYNALEGQAKADADRLLPYMSPSAYTVADLPDWVKVMFTDAQKNLGRYVLLYTKGVKSNALDVQRVREQLGEIVVPADGELPAVTFVSSASYYVSAEAYLVVKREGPLAAVIGLVVVLLVVLTEFRRPKELTMIVVPILASFAIMLGVMVLVNLPLDLFNVIVLPQVFGIGIDTGTHLTHRIKEGGPRVVDNVKHTAYAAGLSSLLTSVGFAALLFTSNVGLQGIGWLAVLGIGTAYAVNIAMFTAFLWLGRPLEKAA